MIRSVGRRGVDVSVFDLPLVLHVLSSFHAGSALARLMSPNAQHRPSRNFIFEMTCNRWVDLVVKGRWQIYTREGGSVSPHGANGRSYIYASCNQHLVSLNQGRTPVPRVELHRCILHLREGQCTSSLTRISGTSRIASRGGWFVRYPARAES